MRSLFACLCSLVLGVSSAVASVTKGIWDNGYEIYRGDINGDGLDDLYFEYHRPIILLHGEIVTPIVLAELPNFVVYGSNVVGGQSYSPPVATTLSGAVIKGLERLPSNLSSTGDFNGDGAQDLLLLGAIPLTLHANGNGLPSQAQIFVADSAIASILSAANPDDVKIKDVNGDGRDDILIGGSVGKTLLANLSGFFGGNTPGAIRIYDYQYDELGRLVRVAKLGTNANASETTYVYDAGGNRVSEATVIVEPPKVPTSISIPSSSTTGSYTINWGSASGTVTTYKLYEATNASFSGQTLVYGGAAKSKTLSGRGSGTYYYRVRACNDITCGEYRAGGNPITVTLPPAVPASISVPSGSNNGNYTVSWGSSSGSVTTYELYEATGSSFSGQIRVYSGTGRSMAISGKGNGAYYYRVRACNGSVCSGYRTGSNSTSVVHPPAPPTMRSGSFKADIGDYSILWSSSSGATRYELWESRMGTGFTKVYDGSDRSKHFTSKLAGEYSYKAKACNSGGCSGFSGTSSVRVCIGMCLD